MHDIISLEMPWYYHQFLSDEKIELLEYAKATGNNEDLTSGVVQFIYDTFPRRVEEILSTKERCDSFRKYLREFLSKRTDVGVSSNEGKVVIVGHSMFFRVYTT